MIIGIDGNEANINHRVGVGQFAYELLLQYYKKNSNNHYAIYLKEPVLSDLPKEKDNWTYRIVKPSKLWTQIGLPFDLFTHRPRPDIFFTPTHYAPRFSPVPTVVAVMDLSYVFFPELFKKRDLYKLDSWTLYSVKNASRVITISESSKNDIIKYYKVPSEKVVVVYPGVKFESNSSTMNSDLLKEKYKIEGDYVLFVGTLQPRKNIEKLIQAFSSVLKESSNKDLSLVIVGKKGWMWENILSSPKKFKVEDNVKFIDYVPDQDLAAFYQNALCYVLPSLYEGFGLPVLEAMKYGCPVITSNVSSLPEAAGDAALYFDPQNAEDIAQKINQLVSDKGLRQKLKEKGFEQVKKFSWEKAARETLQILEEVAVRK